MKKEIVKTVLLALIIPVLVVLAWFLTTNFGNMPQSLLPKISQVIKIFIDMCKKGQLQSDLGISLIRVLKGFLISAVTGILLGSIMGMSKTAAEILQPTITVLRQIPIMAWIPLIILWCGIGETSKIVIIVLASFFPILVNTMSGISQTPQGYIEVASLYKLNKTKTFFKVYLPHALPGIFTGLKLGLGISWMAVVGAEMIAATSGIGYRMSDARNLMRSDIVIACMIVIGIIGMLMDKVIGILFNVCMPWEKSKK